MELELTLHDVTLWMAFIGLVGGMFRKWTVWRVMRDMGTVGMLIYLAAVIFTEGVLAVLGAK